MTFLDDKSWTLGPASYECWINAIVEFNISLSVRWSI